jgi:putative ABC transport system permease protein
MSELHLIWRNLVRRKLRFALTLFAIFIAFLIFGVLGGVRTALQSGVDLMADNRLVTVNKINFTQPLPISYLNKVRAIEGVQVASHSGWFGAYVRDSRNVIVAFAIEPESYLQVYGDEIRLDPAQREAFLRNRQGMIAGEALAKAQGWKLGDRIPVQSNIFSRSDGSTTWEMVVEGIFRGKEESSDTRRMYFHYDYLNESRAIGKDFTGIIVFNTVNPARNETIARQIDALFANSFYETQTDTAKAFNKAFIAQLGNIAMIITSVVSAAFFTILLIVGNTMMLAIRERTTEIAVMKTLGFRSERIFRMVLAESMFLSLLGGLLGIAAALMAVAGLHKALAGVLPDLSLGPAVIAQALAIMLALGLVTGLLPAFAAMRLNIVTALGRN